MNKAHFRFLGLISLILGIILLLGSKISITGAVVGAPNAYSTFSSIFGVVLLIVSVALFVGGESLEEKASAHNASNYRRLKEDLKRREKYGESFFSQILRSDLNRLKNLPRNVNETYDPSMSFERNRKRLLGSFYSDNPNPSLEINDEIREGYRKILDLTQGTFYGRGKSREIAKRIWKNTKRKILKSPGFYKFKKLALKEIQRLDKEALSGRIVPILETHPNLSDDYPEFESKVVYFGHHELYGKYAQNQTDELEKEHLGKDVFKYHIIYDPKNKDKGKIPHGHWELKYIGKR